MIFPWDCPPKKSPSVLLQARGILIPPSAKRAGGILNLFFLKSIPGSALEEL
jgi:hypothetical protein